MKPLNLAKKAIPALRNRIKKAAPNRDDLAPSYWRDISGMLAIAECSQKFLLPANGSLFDLDHIPELAFFNLPGPCVCLEYNIDSSLLPDEFANQTEGVDPSNIYVNKITVAAQPTPNGPIRVFCLTQTLKNMAWGYVPGFIDMWLDDDLKCTCKTSLFAGVLDYRMRTDAVLDDITCALLNDVRTLMSLMEILGCKNIETKKIGGTFTKSGIRITSGPCAKDEYHILTVKPKKVKASVSSDGDEYDDDIPVKTHRSPREHFRRGFIRHLTSGNVWVQSTIVMPGNGGTIFKDYEVKKAKK